MSLKRDTDDTIRMALGVACVQACEYRDPKPAIEPGMFFDALRVEAEKAGDPPIAIRCTRRGANELGACSAMRCPIAAELAPLLKDNFIRTGLERIGIPNSVVDVVNGIRNAVAQPGNIGVNANGRTK